MRPPPAAPRPDLIRRPTGGFGWLDARLLHEHWLAELGPDAIAILVFLVIAADRRGVSYYARDRIAVALGIDLSRVDASLETLLAAGLLAHRPWRSGRRDGVWQVLPLPEKPAPRSAGGQAAVGDVLRDLGFKPPHQNRGS